MLARLLRTGAAATVGLLVATGAVTLPRAALVACLALGIVTGALGGAWAWLTADPPDLSTRDVALLTGAVAIAGGLALAGMTVLLGPATVIALPAIYVLAALSVWHRSRRGRQNPGNPAAGWISPTSYPTLTVDSRGSRHNAPSPQEDGFRAPPESFNPRSLRGR